MKKSELLSVQTNIDRRVRERGHIRNVMMHAAEGAPPEIMIGLHIAESLDVLLAVLTADSAKRFGIEEDTRSGGE